VNTLRWRKSSHSSGVGESECVELAGLASAIVVRDSKDPDGAKLLLSRAEFAHVLAEIKADRPSA
jgi:hypothetical protein